MLTMVLVLGIIQFNVFNEVIEKKFRCGLHQIKFLVVLVNIMRSD